MCISKRLRQACQVKGLKLKGFIETTGLPYRTGQSYLSGAREPNAEGMQIICTRMGVNLNWLVTGKGDVFINDSNHSFEDKLEIELLNNFRNLNKSGKNILITISQILFNDLLDR